jgi:hypothetical protein
MSEESPVLDPEHPVAIEEGPTLPEILTDGFVRSFEQGVLIYKRWVAVCYRLTRETHWLNHGSLEKPRYSLQGPGAEALMNPLGISFERPTFTRENKGDDQGEFYTYWCEGYMESRTLGRRGWYIGYCDSRDPFFNARPGWNPKAGEGDIKKSAMTNWIVNGVTRLAGIRDPDPALLAQAGLEPSRIAAIDYSGRRTPESESAIISEAQRKRLWAICKSQNVSDEMLRRHLELRYSLTSTQAIPRRAYDAICAWAERGGQDLPA